MKTFNRQEQNEKTIKRTTRVPTTSEQKTACRVPDRRHKRQLEKKKMRTAHASDKTVKRSSYVTRRKRSLTTPTEKWSEKTAGDSSYTQVTATATDRLRENPPCIFNTEYKYKGGSVTVTLTPPPGTKTR